MDWFGILDYQVWDNTVLAYLIFLSCVVGSWILGYIVNAIVKGKIKRLAEKTKTKLDDLVVGILGGPVVLLVLLIGMSMGAKSLAPGGFQALMHQIYSALVYVVVAWMLFRAIDGIHEYYLAPFLAKTRTKVDDVLVPVALRAAKLVIAIFVGLLALERFNFRVTPIITFLLDFGLMLVATAAVSTVWLFRSVVGGCIVLFNRPFSEGDTIAVGTIEGKVEKIELHRTIITTTAGVRTAVPNHEFVISTVKLLQVAPIPKNG